MTSPHPTYYAGLEDGKSAASALFPPHENWTVDRNGLAMHPDRHYMRGYIEGYLKAGGKPCRTFPPKYTLEKPTLTGGTLNLIVK